MDEIVDIYVYENRCIETNPCTHFVNITYDDGETIKIPMNSTEIYNLLKNLNRNIPEHFKILNENRN